MENKNKKKKKKKYNKVLTYSIRTGIVLLTTVLLLLIFVIGICFILVHGPSEAAKNHFVCALHETSAMKWVPNLFLSQEEYDQIVNKNLMVDVAEGTVSETSLIEIGKDNDNEDDKKEEIPELE